MKLGSFFKQSIALALCAWILSLSAYAQSEGGRVGFGVSGGGVKYWGTFTDNQLWFAGDMFVRWNIIDQISLQASVGFGQMRYKNTDKAKMENPNFYGLFPADKQPKKRIFLGLIIMKHICHGIFYRVKNLFPIFLAGLEYWIGILHIKMAVLYP